MSALIDALGSRLRSAWFAAHGVAIGASCRFESGVRLARGFHDGRRGTVRIGEAGDLRQGAILEAWGGSIDLGPRVFVGPYCVLYGHGGLLVGAGTLLAMHCRILSSNHAVPAPGTEIRSQPDILLPTRIGRDVWIGAGATILGGVSVGDGCVIGAGAVVTRDLPPGSKAWGVPAEIRGGRRTEPS